MTHTLIQTHRYTDTHTHTRIDADTHTVVIPFDTNVKKAMTE